MPFSINFGLDLRIVRRELAFLSHTVARVEMIDSSQILISQSQGVKADKDGCTLIFAFFPLKQSRPHLTIPWEGFSIFPRMTVLDERNSYNEFRKRRLTRMRVIYSFAPGKL